MKLVLPVWLFLFATSQCSADDWPQWRGPTRDCQIQKTEWPQSLDEEHLKQTWQVPLGPGYSGPLVIGDRVIVTETRDKSHEVVRALDRKTGSELWKTEWQGAMSVPFFAQANGSWIRSTPASDGRHVFVMGMRDVLVCLDIQSGDEVWRLDFVKKFGSALPSFGAICSPLLDGEFLYIQAAASVVKIRKSDGEVVWRSAQEGGGASGSGMSSSAFSSPVIATLLGTRQLVVQARTRMFGLDLDTGKELWSRPIPAMRGMNILTPLVHEDILFTSSYGGGTFGLKVGSAGGVQQVWKTTKQGYMSSPVLIDGHAYVHLKNQRFTCVEVKTGKEKWTSKPFGKYWSMIANGDRLLALDQIGALRLIKATPDKYVELAGRRVSNQSTWAHLAISDGQLFIRGIDEVRAWNWK
jgi:outer membrane protein assembly factor BamB